jgi:hypothetical protein
MKTRIQSMKNNLDLDSSFQPDVYIYRLEGYIERPQSVNNVNQYCANNQQQVHVCSVGEQFDKKLRDIWRGFMHA